TRRVPAPLLAIAVVAIGAQLVQHFHPGFSVATIGSRFHGTVGGVEVHGIPSVLPSPALPWGDHLTFAEIRELLPAAVAIALLGAIESLLSAVIADGMTGTKHDPNAELVGLGIGNILAPLFGGIAATGAFARTATNIRAGARSPVASLTHAGVILLSILFLAPLVAHVPMAALAALLLLVAWNMSELHGFAGVIRIAPKSDVVVLLTCYGLTVLFDMVIAVSVGVVLAAMLFMRRMAEFTEVRSLLGDSQESDAIRLPKGVRLYEISGPLFFGAAQNAMSTLNALRGDDFVVMILHLGKVPVIDGTGLVALDNAIAALVRGRREIVLAGPLPRPRSVFDNARLQQKHPTLHITATLEEALPLAARLAAAREAGPPSSATTARHV
ncbi:MAG: SulP family inorganic anion transporter, partial [Deltaproteobacteria bacterium]